MANFNIDDQFNLVDCDINSIYNNFFEYSPNFVFLYDINGRVIDANNTFKRVLGYKVKRNKKEFSLKDFVILDELIDDDYLTFLKKIVKKNVCIEYKLKTKKNKSIYVEGYSIPLAKEDLNSKFFLHIAFDISGKKEIQKKLKSSHEELKKTSAMIPELRLWSLSQNKNSIKLVQKSGQIIKESEEKYKNILENIQEGYFEIDLNGNLILFNKALSRILEYSYEELIGLHYKKFIDKATINEIKLFLENRLPKKNLQIRLVKKNNEKVCVETSLDVKYNANGEKVGFFGIIRDISERRIFEKKIQQSEKMYKDLFENSPYPIAILNLDIFLIDCNSSLEIVTGYSKSELINRSYKESPLFPQKYLLEFEEIFKSLLRGNAPKPVKIELFKKNNIKIWLNLNFALIEMNDQLLIHILIQDITEIKQSKQRLKRSEQTLHEMNALIEHAPQAILLIHQTGKILRVNEKAKSLFEYAEDELLNFKVFDFFNTKSAEIIKKHYTKDLYNLLTPNEIETYIITKTGKKVHVEIKSTILIIAENIIIQSFFSDITERKNFEYKRQSLLDKLFSSLEFKTKFLATMSHELRTPLNAILGFSQILLRGSYGNLNDEQKDFINDIKSAGTHLLTLINTILDISKIEAGKFELNFEKCDLNNIFKEIEAIINPLYTNKRLEFKIDRHFTNNSIITDHLRFKQILFNLLSNAIKFTNKGEITLRALENENHWEFQVIDTGIGIDKKDYDVVFREFGRVENDKIRSISGAGLGLALTKRLVILHGGDIWFESEFGKGSSFKFTIPKNLKIYDHSKFF